MNQKNQHFASILSIVFFLIIAFGSDESKSDDINQIVQPAFEENLTEAQTDSIKLAKKGKRKFAENALKSFRKKKDDFEDVEFYQDSRTPNYSNVNFIYPYLGVKNDKAWLRLKLQYASDDWLFINNAIFMIDDEKFNISGNWERDNNSGIWEWLDIQVDALEYEILKKLGDSKVAKVRYQGNQYYKDRTITSKEKSIIKKTLEIYNGLR